METEGLRVWLMGGAFAAGGWVIGWIAGRLLLPWLAHRFSKSDTKLDDIILGAVRPHVPWWFLLLGVALGARFPLAGSEVLGWVDHAIEGLFILSITLAIASLINGLLARSSERWGDATQSSSLIQNAIRIGVLALGLLLIASNLGVEITPVLTALGVGSLAVALALQPTLTNLFAGFQVTLARKIRIGDYIELESGEKGFVEDIDWRSTQIRELPNNLIVIPNGKLAELIVKNYSLPVDEQSVVIGVGVSYASDLEKVERVTIDVARKTLKEVTGAAAEFDPFIRYNNFGDSSIDFSVILRVRTFVDRYLVSHEFIKRLHKRFEAEGIEIPFPQRVLTFANPVEVTGSGGPPGKGD